MQSQVFTKVLIRFHAHFSVPTLFVSTFFANAQVNSVQSVLNGKIQKFLPTNFLLLQYTNLREEVDFALGNPSDEKIFVDLLDCGGQLSYSIVQTLSYSVDQSVFILAYNSSFPLSAKIPTEFRQGGKHLNLPAPTMTHGDYLRLWLSTLAIQAASLGHRPTVVVVGTFCESIGDKSSREVRRLLNEFSGHRLRLQGPFFVDNSRPRSGEMKMFRQILMRLIETQAIQTIQGVPLSYLKCEWYLRRYSRTAYQTVAEFESFAKTFAGIPPSEVGSLLRYLHAHCAVRFFDHADAKRGDAIVYLNVPWLLTQVCKLLSCSVTEPPGYFSVVEDINLLKKKGILTTRLADTLWSDGSASTQFRDDLLCVLDKLGLQCPVSSDAAQAMLNVPTNSGPFFFVPICIQTGQNRLADDLSDNEAMPPLVLSTDPLFFPYSEFSRLVVRLLQYYQPPISTVEFNLFYLRFQLTGLTPCYTAEVTHAGRGVAIVLKYSRPEVATSSADDGFSMAVWAIKFYETVRGCMNSVCTERHLGLMWETAFYCAKHDGRWSWQNSFVGFFSGVCSLAKLTVVSLQELHTPQQINRTFF